MFLFNPRWLQVPGFGMLGMGNPRKAEQETHLFPTDIGRIEMAQGMFCVGDSTRHQKCLGSALNALCQQEFLGFW